MACWTQQWMLSLALLKCYSWSHFAPLVDPTDSFWFYSGPIKWGRWKKQEPCLFYLSDHPETREDNSSVPPGRRWAGSQLDGHQGGRLPFSHFHRCQEKASFLFRVASSQHSCHSVVLYAGKSQLKINEESSFVSCCHCHRHLCTSAKSWLFGATFASFQLMDRAN